VKNVTVEDSYIKGAGYVGGIAGYSNDGTVTNCYYLKGTANGGIAGTDIEGQAEAKFAEEFVSGKVAYLLGEAWGQNILKDEYPVLGGEKIIAYTNADGEIIKYYISIENAIAQNPHYIALLADVYGNVYIPSGTIITINLGGKTLGTAATPAAYSLRSTGAGTDMIIVAEDAVLTLTNGTVENDIYVSERGQLTLLEGVTINGTIENDGSVIIDAVPTSEVNFSKAGNIELGSAVGDIASVLAKLKFPTSDEEGYVTVVQSNQVIHGELTFKLQRNIIYDSYEQILNIGDIRVWIGENEITTVRIRSIDGYDYTNAGTKEIQLILGDTEVEYTITYEIVPVELNDVYDFKVTLPYLSPITQGRVSAMVQFNGANVEGTWSAVTMGEDGNYYAVFTPESKNYKEYTYQINLATELAFTAIAFDSFEIPNVPAFIMVDQAHRFSAAATKGETPITDFTADGINYIKYYYSFDENATSGTEFNGDILDLSGDPEANGKQYVYVWAIVEGGNDYFLGATTMRYTIELRRSTDVIGELNADVEELNKLIAEGGDIDVINAALADIAARLETLEAIEGTGDGSIELEMLKDAVSELDEAMKGIQALLENKELGDIAANKEDIAELAESITNLQETVDALGIDGIKSELTSLGERIDDLLADFEELEEKLTAADEAIAALQEAIEALKNASLEDMTDEIEALNTAIADAKALASSGDTALQEELTNVIEAADAELREALESLKTELEEKDAALSEELAALIEEMQRANRNNTTAQVIIGIIATISILGNGALVTWIIIEKRKKAVPSAEAQ